MSSSSLLWVAIPCWTPIQAGLWHGPQCFCLDVRFWDHQHGRLLNIVSLQSFCLPHMNLEGLWQIPILWTGKKAFSKKFAERRASYRSFLSLTYSMGLSFIIWTYFWYSLGSSCTNSYAIFPCRSKCTSSLSLSVCMNASGMSVVATSRFSIVSDP